MLSDLSHAGAPDGQESGLAVAVTGSGGSGAVTAGLILLDAAARAGYYGLLARSAGPQIRGGESAAMLRFAQYPPGCMGDGFAVLCALDWGNFMRFSDELPLVGTSLVLFDPDAGPLPAALVAQAVRPCPIAFQSLASQIGAGRANMVAVGALGAASGLPLAALQEAATAALGGKGVGAIGAALECIALGYAQLPAPPRRVSSGAPPQCWNISGNEAAGLGALRGGVRFVAAYPITPATEMLEWLAPNLERVGGTLVQAEDELASINMAIGGAFGGVPSLTATSGPGLSLMMEGIGLAVASETPIVIVDVMRGGPSTGIPTKSEQSDLNLALYGLHGDAPHLVLAPLDIADAIFTLTWATRLAEHLQTAAIVLSDQSIGQARAIIDPPAHADFGLERLRAGPATPRPYQRYALTPTGISPMSLPGERDFDYTAEGLEHNAAGMPSSMAADHRDQLDKRLRKLRDFDYGPHWACVEGDGDLCLMSWGSSHGAVREAARRLRLGGRGVRVIGLRLLAPLRAIALRQAIGAARVWVIELNQGAQLFHYLLAEQAVPESARSLARAGPLPLRPHEILAALDGEC